jgi:hypothetical protein
MHNVRVDVQDDIPYFPQTYAGMNKVAYTIHVSCITYYRVLQTLLEGTAHGVKNSVFRGGCRKPPQHRAIGVPSTSSSAMAAPTQSTTHATLEEEREGVLQLRTQGLGVTEATLDVFSNFVQCIATNVEPASAANDELLPNRPPPRRSKRVTVREEAPIQVVQTLPMPQPQVRMHAHLPCGEGSRLGFLRGRTRS